MKIAILSDTHDNIWKLAEAMPHLQAADVVIHCGDLCSPFIVKQLGEGLGEIPAHVVWGNNDGDQRLLSKLADLAGNITIHGDFAELDLGGRKIAVTHYPEIARGLAQGTAYDLVCYGHDHIAHQETIGKTVLLNPGEVMGLFGPRSLAHYDTESGEVVTIGLG